MERVFGWLLRITMGSAVFIIAVFLFCFFLISQSIPDYNKTIKFSDLSSTAEIVRDTANVPHLFGASDHDTLFALGYVHAQDRL